MDGPSFTHRLQAVGALFFFALAVIAIVVGTIRGLPGVIVPFLSGGLAVWAGWKALTRRGAVRIGFAVLAVAAGALALVGTAWWSTEFPTVLISIGCAVIGVLLASLALRWIHQPVVKVVSKAHHPVLLVNPRSGDGAAERAGVADEARRRGIKVIELGPDDDFPAMVEAAVGDRTDCIGMAGGDGSLALVATKAMEVGIPFVCIPAGTRNHFAMDLGLDRKDLLKALDGFDNAAERGVDAAKVGDRVFLNNVSIGAYGEIVASPEYRENKVSTALDTIPNLVGPDAEPLDLRFTDGDGVHHDTALVLHVSNNAYDLAPGLGFGGRESLSDGRLGVVAVFTDVVGEAPRMLEWVAERFDVESDGEIASGVDGESVPLDSPVRFEVLPGALRVRVPRDIEGISPTAKRPSLTSRTLQRLWSVASGVTPSDAVPRIDSVAP